jgi:hypothetical protein
MTSWYCAYKMCYFGHGTWVLQLLEGHPYIFVSFMEDLWIAEEKFHGSMSKQLVICLPSQTRTTDVL